MRAVTRPASDHPLTFGNLVLDRDVVIGKRLIQHLLELFSALRPVDISERRVADIIVSYDLVDERKIMRLWISSNTLRAIVFFSSDMKYLL